MREELREHVNEIELAILRFLSVNSAFGQIPEDVKTIEVSQISTNIGVKDKDEVVRALYTLEGKSLARPYPNGDFTSNQWHITDVGLEAMKLLKDAGRIQ